MGYSMSISILQIAWLEFWETVILLVPISYAEVVLIYTKKDFDDHVLQVDKVTRLLDNTNAKLSLRKSNVLNKHFLGGGHAVISSWLDRRSQVSTDGQRFPTSTIVQRT